MPTRAQQQRATDDQPICPLASSQGTEGLELGLQREEHSSGRDSHEQVPLAHSGGEKKRKERVPLGGRSRRETRVKGSRGDHRGYRKAGSAGSEV